MKIYDLSHYNNVTDWDKVKSPVILKATQGNNFIDFTFKKYREESRKRGLFYGQYHFANGGDVIKEAQHFLSTVTDKDGIFVLDWEIEHRNPTAWCNDFLYIIEKETGKKPYLYTNEARANKIDNLNDYKWWIARYGTNNGFPQKEPTKNWTLWQYTSRGSSSGILGFVDENTDRDNPVAETPHLCQRDPRWKDIQLGFGNTTIGSHGCFLTCLSILVDKTPDKVNNMLKAGGGFYEDMIISSKAAKILGLDYFGKEKDINKEPNWYPSIKEVDMSPAPGKQQHFVVRIKNWLGIKNIIDPWTGTEQKINYYPFISYRLFRQKK